MDHRIKSGDASGAWGVAVAMYLARESWRCTDTGRGEDSLPPAIAVVRMNELPRGLTKQALGGAGLTKLPCSPSPSLRKPELRGYRAALDDDVVVGEEACGMTPFVVRLIR